MARPRKPTALKILQGSEIRHKHEPVIPLAEALTAPSWLSASAQDAYVTLGEEFRDLGLLTSLDKTALALLADSWDEYCLLRDQVAQHGHLVDGKASPLVRMMRKARLAVIAALVEFGASPAARTQVTGAKDLTVGVLTSYMQQVHDPEG